MLDFTELSQDGEDLELLTRELCLALSYSSIWSGKGADAGRDLIVIEMGDALFGGKSRRWLVSCKDMSKADAGQGRAVNAADIGELGGIVDAVGQHGAHGFLLVCTTHPSSGLVTRLEDIERNRGVPTQVWDGIQLERMLASPRGWAVAQRFLPRSADAQGWRVFATDSPNRFVVVTRGFYVPIRNRHMSRLPYQLTSLDERLDKMEEMTDIFPEGHELRPRGVWVDDKHGNFVWYVDYLHGRPAWDSPESPPPAFTQAQLEHQLGDGRAMYSDGQFDNFEVTIRAVNRGADWYDPDHYSFYEAIERW